MSFFDSIVASISGTDEAGLASLSRRDRRPLDLNAAGVVTKAAGDVMGLVSAYRSGKAAQDAAEFEAAQLRQGAGQAQASAQRAAIEAGRATELMNSRALAVAAASGAGASDPTVVNLIARNAGEGAYRKAVALYQGDERARLMELQASARQAEGKGAARAGTQAALAQGLKTGTNLLAGYEKGASMFQRFGGGGPGAPVMPEVRYTDEPAIGHEAYWKS